MSNKKPMLGIIGGSGVYEIDGLKNTRWEKVTSSFGKPYDSLFFGELSLFVGDLSLFFGPFGLPGEPPKSSQNRTFATRSLLGPQLRCPKPPQSLQSSEILQNQPKNVEKTPKISRNP